MSHLEWFLGHIQATDWVLNQVLQSTCVKLAFCEVYPADLPDLFCQLHCFLPNKFMVMKTCKAFKTCIPLHREDRYYLGCEPLALELISSHHNFIIVLPGIAAVLTVFYLLMIPFF